MSPDFVKQKAREISYALIRVSFYVRRGNLRSRLEDLAIELLENSARAGIDGNLTNLNHALETISVLDGLVRLAHSIYEIEPVNATLLVRELDSLNSAIRQSGNPANDLGELPNLENLFSKAPVISISKKVETAKQNSIPEEIKLSTEVFSEPLKREERSNEERNNVGNGINTAIRQAAIVNRIKSGNESGCRLKDLIAEFPDVSERTLRYDLQRLCEQRVIDRVGNGGPASYYVYNEERLKDDLVNVSGAVRKGVIN